MSSENPEKPRIIVDDDWKSKVATEREQLKAQRVGDTATGGNQSQSPKESSREQVPSEEGRSFPPASFSILVSTLATQALHCMGQLPDPESKELVFRPNEAKHFIDTLAILLEKTKGNLTPSEAGMLDNVLHELRMGFVSLKNSQQSGK